MRGKLTLTLEKIPTKEARASRSSEEIVVVSLSVRRRVTWGRESV